MLINSPTGFNVVSNRPNEAVTGIQFTSVPIVISNNEVTSLWLIFAGMLLFSAGFFAAHSVASSWIGPRAKRAKGQASSLYLFSYYLGSSIAGTLGGVFWHSYGWNGVGGFIALMLVLALLVGARLHHRLHV